MFRKFKMMAICVALTACGTNNFKDSEKKDPAEDATKYLEQDKPDEAITLLTKALDADPNNYQYIGILATAYGQKAGIEPFRMIQSLATQDSSTESSTTSATDAGGGQFGTMFAILPVPTTAVLESVDKAIALLQSIPAASRITAHNVLLSLFLTSSVTLRIKALDLNGDGKVTPDEVLLMNPQAGVTVLTQLAIAAATAAGIDTSSADGQSSAAAEKIQGMQTAIQDSPGDTDQQKLQNYLQNKKS